MNLTPRPETRERRVVDMSPEAIDRRLRTLSDLHRLGMSLRTVRWLGKVHDLRANGVTELPSTTPDNLQVKP
jgi:hypothetical protein